MTMLHKKVFYDNRYYTVTEFKPETGSVEVEPCNSGLVKKLRETLIKNLPLRYHFNTDTYELTN